MGVKSPDQVDVEVGQRIKVLRNDAGISQTVLAEELGVTFQQVQKYEKGVNRVGAGRLTKIAGVLNVPVSKLLGTRRGLQRHKQQAREFSFATAIADNTWRATIITRIRKAGRRGDAPLNRCHGRNCRAWQRRRVEEAAMKGSVRAANAV